ncbi:MAG: hypothetical protein LBL59_00320 [Xanthomonadaceae bacterium]|jgi:hypothetical protein|nr:hypothetical protein [Xanthomonadaceae bacterium]
MLPRADPGKARRDNHGIVGCGRHAAVLYGGTLFVCRHGQRLTYASTRENAGERAIRRVAERIRERSGWEPGILNGDGGKPKGMHGRTHERLMQSAGRA